VLSSIGNKIKEAFDDMAISKNRKQITLLDIISNYFISKIGKERI
jgi:hypothetical protein